MRKENPAVVLLSGGQDSSTCLFWAIDKFKKVYALGFDYGQRHKLELKLAARIAENAGVEFHISKVSVLGEVSENSLTSLNIKVESDVQDGQVPNTVVEGRNLLFLSYAAIYAKSMAIENLVMGVSQTDFSGYPDCREVFIKSAEQTLRLAMEVDFKVHTPLMHLSKAQTWSLAEKFGVVNIIKEGTLTCYNGIQGEGCGECPACMLRAKGWNEFIQTQ